MHLIGFRRNSRQAPETDARASVCTLARVCTCTRTSNTAPRMGRRTYKATCTCVHVSRQSPRRLSPPPPPGVCTITVYIIGAGQHVDRERPLLHQTPWSSSTDPFTANLPTIATLDRVYKRLDTSAIPNGTAEYIASCPVIRSLASFLAADLSAAPPLNTRSRRSTGQLIK